MKLPLKLPFVSLFFHPIVFEGQVGVGVGGLGGGGGGAEGGGVRTGKGGGSLGRGW